MDWSHVVDYCNVFISCLDSHSDGTHSLQRIHWRASDVMLNFSKSDEETNSFISWMPKGWIQFWVNYSFKKSSATVMCKLQRTSSVSSPDLFFIAFSSRFKIQDFICHIHNYTEYNQQWNVSQVRSMDSAIIWNTNTKNIHKYKKN